ncbi:hypothetical protein KKH23_10775 [Patescibacteria group bacterium]|nr:hypothetical protein [Patescibacteria group bacterium]
MRRLNYSNYNEYSYVTFDDRGPNEREILVEPRLTPVNIISYFDEPSVATTLHFSRIPFQKVPRYFKYRDGNGEILLIKSFEWKPINSKCEGRYNEDDPYEDDSGYDIRSFFEKIEKLKNEIKVLKGEDKPKKPKKSKEDIEWEGIFKL